MAALQGAPSFCSTRVCQTGKRDFISGRRLVTLPPPKCSPVTPEVLEAAWMILDNFNNNDVKGLKQQSLSSKEGLAALTASVLVAAEAALANENSKPLISVCADSSEEAMEALQSWTQALGYSEVGGVENVVAVPGPVYMKYNVASQKCYAQPYQGGSRGVILQLGERQVGHLPAHLFSK